jgi:GNAT superfamily N-acetyltransferase
MTITDASFEMALPDDLQRVLPFIKSYYGFDGIPFHLGRLTTALDALLRDPSRGRVWIICVDSKDIGYVVLAFGYDLEFGGPQATLTEFYIIPAYRRRGIGMRTMQFVEDRCRELGIGALELQVQRDNIEAQAFYRRLKFEAHDRIPMSKKLNQNS